MPVTLDDIFNLVVWGMVFFAWAHGVSTGLRR